jgi:hypothetical protein
MCDERRSLSALADQELESALRESAEARVVSWWRQGQMDERWSYEDLLAQLAEAAGLGPLNVGPVVTVSTYEPIDFSVLWERVRSASQASNGLHRAAASRNEG